jgi:hypothetical protein
MPAEHCVLVTRPEGQAQALLAAIAAQGMRALHLPMLRLEPLEPLPPAVRQCIIDLDRYDHLVFISANAARIGLSLIDDYWPQYPAGQQCWAVGASTARALERAGLAVCAPREDMTSEGLLAMPGLGDLSGQRVLIVKGEGGRRTLEDQFAARGARVDDAALLSAPGPVPDCVGMPRRTTRGRRRPDTCQQRRGARAPQPIASTAGKHYFSRHRPGRTVRTRRHGGPSTGLAPPDRGSECLGPGNAGSGSTVALHIWGREQALSDAKNEVDEPRDRLR